MTTNNATLTPMLRQYQELKRQHPGTLLFFRLGDFYELFFEDAVTGARELEITLTARHKERGQPIPMCGVPHHAVADHIARLVRKGYRVAICEQTEDPSKAKKLVRREVVRVITPGTAIDPHLIEAQRDDLPRRRLRRGRHIRRGLPRPLDRRVPRNGGQRPRRLGAHPRRHRILRTARAALPALALAARQRRLFDGAHTAPLPLGIAEPQGVDEHDEPPVARSLRPSTTRRVATACRSRRSTTGCGSRPPAPRFCSNSSARARSKATGSAGKIAAVSAAGACLRYARETQRAAAAHVTDINFFETHDHLVLDAVTCRNLELVESQGRARARALPCSASSTRP